MRELQLKPFSEIPVLGPHWFSSATSLACENPWLRAGKLRRKRWQFISVTTEDLLIGCGMVDISFAANVFFTVVDLKTRAALFDASYMAMPGVTLQINDHPTLGALARFSQGSNEIVLRDSSTAKDQLQLEWKGKLESGGQNISFDFTFAANRDARSLLVGAEPHPQKYACTVKSAPLKVSGKINVGSQECTPTNARACLDFTTGELPRETQWFWASLAQGELALNLAQGNNLGGQNENCLWDRGKLIALPPVEFRLPEITSHDGSIKLHFEPAVYHREQRNLLLVKSNFTQMFGFFSGKLLDHQLDRVPGIAEDQAVKW